MISLALSWAFDKIDAVRQKAIVLLEVLFLNANPTIAESKIIPKLISFQNCQSYLQRQLVLHVIERTTKLVSSEIINNSYLGVMAYLSKDKVPNIRFLVLRILRNNPTLMTSMRFKNIAESLLDDKDI